MRQSPRWPSHWTSANCAAPRTREPAGSSMVTSIDPPALRGDHERSFGARTNRWPLANSTRVRSAAFLSSSLDGSLGCTSTTVAALSPALIRMSPITTSMVARIGSEVSKVGMGPRDWQDDLKVTYRRRD